MARLQLPDEGEQAEGKVTWPTARLVACACAGAHPVLKRSAPSSHSSSNSGSSVTRTRCATTLAGNHKSDSASWESSTPLLWTVQTPEKIARTRMPTRISAGTGRRYARAVSVDSTHEAGSPSSHAIWTIQHPKDTKSGPPLGEVGSPGTRRKPNVVPHLGLLVDFFVNFGTKRVGNERKST